jgi:hypothetical protein
MMKRGPTVTTEYQRLARTVSPADPIGELVNGVASIAAAAMAHLRIGDPQAVPTRKFPRA